MRYRGCGSKPLMRKKPCDAPTRPAVVSVRVAASIDSMRMRVIDQSCRKSSWAAPTSARAGTSPSFQVNFRRSSMTFSTRAQPSFGCRARGRRRPATYSSLNVHVPALTSGMVVRQRRPSCFHPVMTRPPEITGW